MFDYFLLLLAAYFIGALPWTRWLLRSMGRETPREGPCGPWQALYYGGPLTALASLWGEGSKGALTVLLLERRELDPFAWGLLLAVVLGQQWAPWREGRGRSGLLALLGGLFLLAPAAAQGILTAYTAALILLRRRSWATMAGVIALLPSLWLAGGGGEGLVMASLVFLLLWGDARGVGPKAPLAACGEYYVDGASTPVEEKP